MSMRQMAQLAHTQVCTNPRDEVKFIDTTTASLGEQALAYDPNLTRRSWGEVCWRKLGLRGFMWGCFFPNEKRFMEGSALFFSQVTLHTWCLRQEQLSSDPKETCLTMSQSPTTPEKMDGRDQVMVNSTQLQINHLRTTSSKLLVLWNAKCPYLCKPFGLRVSFYICS